MPRRFLHGKATAFRNRQNLRHKKGTHWVSSLFLLRPAWAAMRSVPLCSKPLFAKTISARFCPANARIQPTAMRPTLKQSHARIDLLGNRPCANCFLRCLLPHGEILSARTLPAAKPYPFYNRALFALCLCHTRRPSCFFTSSARLRGSCRLRQSSYIAAWPLVLRDKKISTTA